MITKLVLRLSDKQVIACFPVKFRINYHMFSATSKRSVMIDAVYSAPCDYLVLCVFNSQCQHYWCTAFGSHEKKKHNLQIYQQLD